MPVVTLPSLKALERVILALGHRLEQANLAAAWTASQWSVSAATKATNRAKINASQTFARSWLCRRVKDGAFVANSAAHAYFVERGRKPGKGPPLAPIEEWIRLKKIMPSKPPKVSLQAARRAVIGKGITGNLSGSAKQRARLRADIALRTKIHRSDFARAYRHNLAIKELAKNIARKIARRGTKAKFILGRLLQAIGRRYYRDIKKQHAKITASPPR